MVTSKHCIFYVKSQCYKAMDVKTYLQVSASQVSSVRCCHRILNTICVGSFAVYNVFHLKAYTYITKINMPAVLCLATISQI